MHIKCVYTLWTTYTITQNTRATLNQSAYTRILLDVLHRISILKMFSDLIVPCAVDFPPIHIKHFTDLRVCVWWDLLQIYFNFDRSVLDYLPFTIWPREGETDTDAYSMHAVNICSNSIPSIAMWICYLSLHVDCLFVADRLKSIFQKRLAKRCINWRNGKKTNNSNPTVCPDKQKNRAYTSQVTLACESLPKINL